MNSLVPELLGCRAFHAYKETGEGCQGWLFQDDGAGGDDKLLKGKKVNIITQKHQERGGRLEWLGDKAEIPNLAAPPVFSNMQKISRDSYQVII